jgi:hypothetical protein
MQHLNRFISIVAVGAVAASAACVPVAMAFEQLPAALVGTWTGTALQNKGKSNCVAVMTITASGGATDYPELKCGGVLTRVGQAGGYVFFTETIKYGGQASGGGCIDGTITVAAADDKLARGLDGKFPRGNLCGLEHAHTKMSPGSAGLLLARRGVCCIAMPG